MGGNDGPRYEGNGKRTGGREGELKGWKQMGATKSREFFTGSVIELFTGMHVKQDMRCNEQDQLGWVGAQTEDVLKQ